MHKADSRRGNAWCRLWMLLCFLAHLASAQQPDDPTLAATRAKAVLKEFESAFNTLTNPYITDAAQRKHAAIRLQATLRRDARFENDLVPVSRAAQLVRFEDYKRIAISRYGTTGLTFDLEWEAASRKREGDGYLVILYGRKTLLGTTRDHQSLHLENVPCRAGVYLDKGGNAKIGFMDTVPKSDAEAVIAFWDHETLHLDLQTNQGAGTQSYYEGDLMKVRIRASKPCTVRLLYQDAAGNLLWLRNSDIPVSPDAVGQWIDIPDQFQCAAPFGQEMLLAYATEGRFKPLTKTRYQHGYTFILDDRQHVAEQMDVRGKPVMKSTIRIITYPRKR